MSDRDFYKKWFLKRLSKINTIHDQKSPNRTQITLYNMGIRQREIARRYE